MKSHNTQKSKEQKKGILIAQVEAEIRDFIIDLLNKNYQIFVASDGWEVKNCFRHFGKRINLVIADLQLPDTDWKKLVFWLREQNESLPILLIIGDEGKINLERLLALDKIALLRKPFNIKELLEKLHSLID
ncbi:MAG: response regulator [Acidobacteriota bacterium]|nr:response regulator [Acidobacteriota bacterium]